MPHDDLHLPVRSARPNRTNEIGRGYVSGAGPSCAHHGIRLTGPSTYPLHAFVMETAA